LFGISFPIADLNNNFERKIELATTGSLAWLVQLGKPHFTR